MAILGIDEVGRGPWAGPLVIGAAVLKPRYDKNENHIESELWQDALTDSKKLTAIKREKLSPIILENAVATGLGWVSASELDKIGLSEALRLATRRAVCKLIKKSTGAELDKKMLSGLPEKLPFGEIIIDGTQNFLKGTDLENLVSVLPKADLKIKEVSAASIIAKVARDHYMIELAKKYPGYGFEKHVGYGTARHRSALHALGICPEHRQSYKPVGRFCDSAGISAATGAGVKEADVTEFCALSSDNGSVCESRTRNDGLRLECSARNCCSSASAKNTTITGRRAESIVADYLSHHGHTILARNFKTKYYEIDIVSATTDHIYFTEVKYRKNSTHGDPLEFIDQKKQQQITFAANAFMGFLSKKLNRSLDNLPSPILAAASVSGPEFKLDNWLELVV